MTIGFERLPWLDPEFPQVSKRFANVMARRTVIERLHKLMKYDFGDDRLRVAPSLSIRPTKRGSPPPATWKVRHLVHRGQPKPRFHITNPSQLPRFRVPSSRENPFTPDPSNSCVGSPFTVHVYRQPLLEVRSSTPRSFHGRLARGPSHRA